MDKKQIMYNFITDWFYRFDRLDPVDAFLPNLHPDVEWDMPDVDRTLHGHARFRAWYVGVLASFLRPTQHDLSEIDVQEGTVSFKVRLRAQLAQGSHVDVTAREIWRYQLSEEGFPLLTHYSVKI
ncbi:hypothetical protein C0V73_12875 [Rhizobium sp. TH135]|uniref:nuclear transport factor 2 family protein n=1 Tax=Rhizobium sp. TH135 TaxID=2067451 RepID=UPI000C7D0F65|nr:nuclear transport factor 2 family protein [Rhizobium sp. TH135]PLK70268.1 hypothetical protein C0V73_12875 [Rhizobium sp. TH135]